MAKGKQTRVDLDDVEYTAVRVCALEAGVPVSVWLAEAAREKMAREGR